MDPRPVRVRCKEGVNADEVFSPADELWGRRSVKADRATVTSVPIHVAPADLLDRIAVLEIKSERLTSDTQLRNVRAELATLHLSRDRSIPSTPELLNLALDLRRVNEALWDLEEAVRHCEAAEDFGETFVRSARSIIHANNRRTVLKRAINALLGADFQEEKSYPLPDPMTAPESRGPASRR